VSCAGLSRSSARSLSAPPNQPVPRPEFSARSPTTPRRSPAISTRDPPASSMRPQRLRPDVLGAHVYDLHRLRGILLEVETIDRKTYFPSCGCFSTRSRRIASSRPRHADAAASPILLTPRDEGCRAASGLPACLPPTRHPPPASLNRRSISDLTVGAAAAASVVLGSRRRLLAAHTRGGAEPLFSCACWRPSPLISRARSRRRRLLASLPRARRHGVPRPVRRLRGARAEHPGSRRHSSRPRPAVGR